MASRDWPDSTGARTASGVSGPSAPVRAAAPAPVQVDQVDQDLPPVAGVHRAGRVDYRDPVPGGEAGTRVDQADVPRRHRDRDPGPHQGPLPRREGDVVGGVQIQPRVGGMRVRRKRQVGIEPPDVDADAGQLRHSRQTGCPSTSFASWLR